MRPAKHRLRQRQQSSLLGGIMVSQEVTIDFQEASQAAGMTSTPQMIDEAVHRRTPARENQGTADGEGIVQDKAGKNNSRDRVGLRNSEIELDYITTIPNMGVSNVEVKKGDEGATFVDELLAGCMDKRT